MSRALLTSSLRILAGSMLYLSSRPCIAVISAELMPSLGQQKTGHDTPGRRREMLFQSSLRHHHHHRHHHRGTYLWNAKQSQSRNVRKKMRGAGIRERCDTRSHRASERSGKPRSTRLRVIPNCLIPHIPVLSSPPRILFPHCRTSTSDTRPRAKKYTLVRWAAHVYTKSFKSWRDHLHTEDVL